MTTEGRAFRTLLLAVSLEPREIGRRIAAARLRRGLTQFSFAVMANVSPGTIQRWEAGKLPPVRELMRVAKLLDVPVDELVEADEATSDREDLAAVAERIEAAAETIERKADSLAKMQERLEALLAAQESLPAAGQLP